MIDKRLVERRFASHFETYNNLAKVQDDVCERLVSYISDLKIMPTRALEIGAGTGFLTKRLTRLYPMSRWVINDISPKANTFLESICNENHIDAEFIYEDGESLSFSEPFDLIVSASAIQWFNNIEDFIGRIPSKSGSIVAISTFTSENFKEIAFATQSDGLKYYNAEDFRSWFEKAGYKEHLCSHYTTTLEFASPLEVLRHLKYTGVNSIKNVGWSRGKLNDFCDRYNSKFSSKNGVILTYNPILMIFQKK